MAIYTKRGDKGKTSLYGKVSQQRVRVLKNSLRIRAIGGIDELNSYLGIVISSSHDSELNNRLKDIQRDLLSLGSIIAGGKLRFFASKTKQIEKEIDKLEGKLPVLKNFILPGGSSVAAHLQYARALARKAERLVVALNEKEKIRPQILTYLNRLSDLLFMLARDANSKVQIKEEVWPGKKGV